VLASSQDFKEAIKPMDKASEAIRALQPVTFRYKHEIDPEGIPQFGLVAEQVEKVSSDLVIRDQDGKPYSVRYDAINAMLLNEFLKDHRRVEELEKRIHALAVTGQKVMGQLPLSSQELTSVGKEDEFAGQTATNLSTSWKLRA
jgi:Chaperone of endosialidase